MADVKTINLQGKDYAKVSTRIKELHSRYENASIETDIDFREGWAILKAVVTPNVEKPERTFTGHSMGQVSKEKALEKLESVAVGRALANAGFLATGEIATYEEMEKFQDSQEEEGKNGDSFKEKTKKINADAINKRIAECESRKEMEELWSGLNTYARNNAEVVKAFKAKAEDFKDESPIEALEDIEADDFDEVVNEMES